MDPRNIVVLVTGGAEGIGYEIANQYLVAGAKVTILVDINEELGNQAAETLNRIHGNNKAYFFKCNVTLDLQSVTDKIFEKFGYVHLLVNNVGVSEQDPDKVIDTNLTALIKWSFKYWELMRNDKEGRGGTIINIASAHGLKTEPHFPAYHASKFGVIGFSRSIGHEVNYKRSGVRIIVLCPGYTKTKLTKCFKTFDDEFLLDHYREIAKTKQSQDAAAVGKAAVEVFKIAKSADVWLIQGGNPIVRVNSINFSNKL